MDDFDRLNSYDSTCTKDMEERIEALCLCIGCDKESVRVSYHDDQIFIVNDREEYRVLTDNEADNAEDESIQSYIDECVLLEIPKHYHFYFDEELFKKDCRYDGRGHYLATYDGVENCQELNNTYYYIYRIN